VLKDVGPGHLTDHLGRRSPPNGDPRDATHDVVHVQIGVARMLVPEDRLVVIRIGGDV
jgi:hypothetical protein